MRLAGVALPASAICQDLGLSRHRVHLSVEGHNPGQVVEDSLKVFFHGYCGST